MDEIFNLKKCTTHPQEEFGFYCFDDKAFMCEKCFKPHKKHNFEIKQDLIDSDNAYKSLKGIKEPLSIVFKQIKDELLKVKDLIEKELLKIDEYLNLNEKLELIREKKDVFDMSFKEYENMNIVWGSYNIFNKISENLNNIKKLPIFKIKEQKNSHYANFELNVNSSSSVHPNFPLDIMLGRLPGEYTLFNGNKNHFVIFDLLNDHFIKNLRIKGRPDFNCTPKNFKISVKKSNGNWEEPKPFIAKEFFGDYQYFDICEEGRFVRIDFIDTWGTIGGNYILLKELALSIADLVSTAM